MQLALRCPAYLKSNRVTTKSRHGQHKASEQAKQDSHGRTA